MLGVEHLLGAVRIAPAQRPAELADALRAVVMDVLADERRAPAVRAALAVQVELDDPFAEEPQLEIGREQGGKRARHGRVFEK